MTIVSDRGKSYEYNNLPIPIDFYGLIYKGIKGNIKPFNICVFNVDEDKIEMVRHEMQILLGIQHEKLVNMMDIFVINKDNAPKGAAHGLYVVNENIDGVELSDVIEGALNYTNEFAQQILNLYKTDPYVFAKYIIKNILLGIMELHNHGIYLNEIEPSCIIITLDKKVKINPVLIMMKRYANNNSLNMEYNMSNQYLAPELFSNRGVHNQTVDFYSTGILFFQLITGHLPFNNSTFFYPPKIIPLKNVAKSRIRKIIKHATEKDPDKRFQSAMEFIEAIDNLEKSNYHFSLESIFSCVTKAISRFRKNIKDKNDSVNITEIKNIHNNTRKRESPVFRSYIIEKNSSYLTIRFGNILESNAEVIVSSDDNTLSMSGGVSEAIASMGGNTIQNDAKKNIPVQLGDMIITTAGELPQKYIFHCVTIDYKNEIKQEHEKKKFQEYIIRRSVDKCLRMMPLLGIKSIAFPTLGAGVAQFSLEEIAICMTDVITDFLYSTNKQYHIEICLYDQLKRKDIMDYMAFFENIAVNIAKKKERKTKKEELDLVENAEIEEKQIQPLGTLAAISPHEEHKVFVSYSRKDIEFARVFCKKMDELGFSYWIDINGKYSGKNFKEVLVDAIDASQMVLFLSSINSNQSPFVVKEISLAVAGKKKILPIKLDDSPYAKSIRFDLGDIDWIEFTKDNSENALEKFRNCMQLYLNR